MNEIHTTRRNALLLATALLTGGSVATVTGSEPLGTDNTAVASNTGASTDKVGVRKNVSAEHMRFKQSLGDSRI